MTDHQDTTTGKTCFYCNHPGAYLGMPEDEEVNICACCSWVDGHEKRSECFEHVERERDEARAEVERVRETLAEDLESWYCTNPDAASLAGDILALIRDYRT